MANKQSQKGGKGGRKSGNASRKAGYSRHYGRLAKAKDRRVKRSSHGKFEDVAALERHRAKVAKVPQETTKRRPGRGEKTGAKDRPGWVG